LLDTRDGVPGFLDVLGGSGIPVSGENFDTVVVGDVCLTSGPHSSSKFRSSLGFEFPEDSAIHWLELSVAPAWTNSRSTVFSNGCLKDEIGPLGEVYVEKKDCRIVLGSVSTH
jgi:hypothetical protein